MPFYTKDDKFVCKVCGKTVQKYNKWQHENRRFHKLIKFCKENVNKMINESQLNSVPNNNLVN